MEKRRSIKHTQIPLIQHKMRRIVHNIGSVNEVKNIEKPLFSREKT